jgi:Lon protease-like protein
MALNIFEPRYRLMVRRCMEGSRRLGMAVVTGNDGLHEVATECEIVECQPLPDG